MRRKSDKWQFQLNAGLTGSAGYLDKVICEKCGTGNWQGPEKDGCTLSVVAELTRDGRALRLLLFAASEIVNSCAHQVDLIFPNDKEPEMQERLRELVLQLKTLANSEVGVIRPPENMIADAAKEERLKKERAEAVIKERDKEIADLRKRLHKACGEVQELSSIMGAAVVATRRVAADVKELENAD